MKNNFVTNCDLIIRKLSALFPSNPHVFVPPTYQEYYTVVSIHWLDYGFEFLVPNSCLEDPDCDAWSLVLSLLAPHLPKLLSYSPPFPLPEEPPVPDASGGSS